MNSSDLSQCLVLVQEQCNDGIFLEYCQVFQTHLQSIGVSNGAELQACS
ncbi:hypothetical protein T4C_2990 [Trichinella pseudospiralis]|uniref:Uncharacterized protein n=1 Tax=Trichinella pseudospiralis TaxID=6337 RepID=A0A0V1JLN6_TRIPS|nr:hypothetical protein T4C_2990 [Trichinella pseudospiralis]